MMFDFSWKRLGGFRTVKERNVVGLGYLGKETDKLVVRYSGGGIKEIPQWSLCQFTAGPDFHATEQEELNKRAGQVVPLINL